MPPRNPNPDRHLDPDRSQDAGRASALWELGQIERGPDVLALLDRHLYLTNDQIERVLFRTGLTGRGRPRRSRGAPYAANTALRRLHDAGMVGRVPVYLPARTTAGVHPHFVNVLTGAGARAARPALVAGGTSPRWRRSLLPGPWRPIAHGFWVREVVSALMLAAARAGLVLDGWADDRLLAADVRGDPSAMPIIPDGRFTLRAPDGMHGGTYLLEVDLDTAVLRSRQPGRRDWSRKVTAYAAMTTRELRRRYASDLPVIVLTATTSETRIRHLLEATAHAGGQGRFWFTTLSELIPPPLSPTDLRHQDAAAPDGAERAIARHEAQTLGPIWRVPSDKQPRSLLNRHGHQLIPSSSQVANERVQDGPSRPGPLPDQP